MDSTLKFEGALEKTSGLFKNKTKIWMVLEGLSITHYKDSKKTFCVGSIDITEVQTARQTGQKQGREFEITTRNTTYKFTAEADELAAAWVTVVQQSMLQKSSINNPSSTAMASSNYAEICEVTTVQSAANRHSPIYEELDNIPTHRERNIFGVQLKSSFHRTNRTGSRSSSSSDTSNPDATVAKAGQLQPASAEKKEEPIYAKPDKIKTKSPFNEIKENTKEGTPSVLQNNAFASTLPPPKHDSNTPKTNKLTPEQSNLPSTSQKVSEKTVVDNKSEYSTIEDLSIKDKEKPSDIDTSVDDDDEHRYHLADPVKREACNIPVVSTVEAEKANDVAYSEDSEHGNTEIKSEPEVVIRNKHLEGAYEDIDTSQVVRRTRGSHLTHSFSEDGSGTLDAAENLRGSRNGRNAFNGQNSASLKRQNFRGSKQADEDDDEDNDVFTNSDEPELSQTGDAYETIEYGANLKALVTSVVSTVDANDIKVESPDNGKAFLNLKQYLEKYADNGFDIDTHDVSSCNSIQRLQELLSP